MKQLNEHTGSSAGWDNSLIKDLSYIKANLRYPIKTATIMPVLMWAAFILLMMALVSVTIYQRTGKGESIPALNIIMAASTTILFVINIVRYLQSLKFISVHTGNYLKENIQSLETFLKSQQMLVFRHPDAPEIFQIQSRNLSAGKEDREVIIFIADDQRILINSHFTNKGWGFAPSQRHHRQMAGMLRKYMQYTAGSASVIHKTF
jgi:hypothetical protein